MTIHAKNALFIFLCFFSTNTTHCMPANAIGSLAAGLAQLAIEGTVVFSGWTMMAKKLYDASLSYDQNSGVKFILQSLALVSAMPAISLTATVGLNLSGNKSTDLKELASSPFEKMVISPTLYLDDKLENAIETIKKYRTNTSPNKQNKYFT